MTKWVVLLAIVAQFRGCGVAEGPDEGVRIVEVYNGSQACRHTIGVAVARTDRELEALWYDATCSNSDLPSVDFARDMVVAYFMGERPTTGYRAEIVDADYSDLGVLIHVVHEIPGEGCVVGQAVTQPVVVVRMPRQSGTVTAAPPRTERRDCQ